MDGRKIIEKWASHIIGTRFEDIPEKDVALAKAKILDIIGCNIGGVKAPGNGILKEVIEEWNGRKEATILGYGVKAPCHNVAMVNAVMARSFDFGVLIPYIDDRPILAHISETMVPVVLAVGEWKGASGKDIITALVISEDITTRLTAASIYAPAVSWDSPGTVNRFGATVAASKLMGLKENQIINALGIILNMLGGTFQGIQEGTYDFKLNQGLAARDGIMAALLASKGWIGVKDPLFGKYGYFNIFTQGCNPDILTSELGEKYYGDLTFKPYPCCREMQGVIDCALQIASNEDIEPQDIEEIIVNMSCFHANSPLVQPFFIGEFPQGIATFNVRYNAANALLRKCVKLEHFTEPYICDSQVFQLAQKIKVLAELPKERIAAIEFEVKKKDGKRFFAQIEHPKGDPLVSPLTPEEIVEKFKTNVAFSGMITKENSEKAIGLINNLENIKSIAELIRLLTHS